MPSDSRRPAASWPAALLPTALLAALLAGGAGSLATSALEDAPDEPPVTELHVVHDR